MTKPCPVCKEKDHGWIQISELPMGIVICTKCGVVYELRHEIDG